MMDHVKSSKYVLHAYKALVFAAKLSHPQLINADGSVVT